MPPTPTRTLIQRFGDAWAALQGKPAAAAPVLKQELGWGGGVSITGQLFGDETVPELRGREGIRVARRMRRTDAQVRAVHTAISLPVRSTAWYVDEPDAASAAEKEAAELLRENLFGGMEGSWDDLLRELLFGVYYGFRIPEIVLEEQAGLLAIRKVAPRNPELLERWLYDPDGRLCGYLYSGNRPIGIGLNAYGGNMSRWERVPVPIEKTLHFIYDQENDHPEGDGIWRTQWRPHMIKQALISVMCVGVERNLLDVPVGTVGPGDPQSAIGKFLTLLGRWRAGEEAALVLPADWKLQFYGSQRGLMDPMPLVYRMNFEIAMAGLASFLNLGQSDVGTQALSGELAKTFMDAENGIARALAGTIERCLTIPWTRLNFPEPIRPPKLMFRKISARSLTEWSTALQMLAGSGFLHPGPDDEANLRDQLELPLIPVEQLRQQADDRAMAAAAAAQAAKAAQERLNVPNGGPNGNGKPPPPGDRPAQMAEGRVHPPSHHVRIEPLPLEVEVTRADVRAAEKAWDEEMESYAGLLDAAEA